VKPPTIGVFDSGVGGLTVLAELVRQVPAASFLYFGDTARLPYGSKSPATVARYAVSSAHFLEQHGAELLVVACNTATALALEQIQQASAIPAIGVIEPGAEAAAAASRARKAVVIGTEATISSHAYQRALSARGLVTREKACPLLVPLVEEGWTDHAVTEQVARIYLDEAFANGSEAADVLVLGCTHYPLLKPLLRRITPPHVTIVDSAESTARAVHVAVGDSGSKLETRNPKLQFFATDSVEKFKRLGSLFLGRSLDDVTHVDIDSTDWQG
jgi:glutamate racemase